MLKEMLKFNINEGIVYTFQIWMFAPIAQL